MQERNDPCKTNGYHKFPAPDLSIPDSETHLLLQFNAPGIFLVKDVEASAVAGTKKSFADADDTELKKGAK
jgi:hypothetical protein